jgi:SAM-dependent methyltransferase
MQAMSLTYETIVPWGRSFDEYRHMFALSAHDLEMRILGCGDGPASFNAQLTARGGRVVSCDPLYRFSAQHIRQRIEASYQTVMEQTGQNQDKYVWQAIPSLDELGKVRMAAMCEFLADYEHGAQDGRYVSGESPILPFAPAAFELALCSHFLFLYTDNLSLEFHQQAILDMLRVANEVRIFPVLTYNAETSLYLEPVCEGLEDAGYKVSIELVPYEFQRGGDKMMKVGKEQ